MTGNLTTDEKMTSSLIKGGFNGIKITQKPLLIKYIDENALNWYGIK